MECPSKFESSFEFEVDKEAKLSKCRTCAKILAGTQKYNNFRHILYVHPEIAARYDQEASTSKKRSAQPSKSPSKVLKVEIDMDAVEFKRTCVEMIATEACAYRLMDRPTFKRLVKPYEKSFQVTVNSKNAKVWVREDAENIRQLISTELKDSMISIKLDLASRYGHSVLGVNAQIVTKAKIIVRTLGMVGMNRRHTAANIVDEIRALLAIFGLRLEQVYSWTSDNAANMIAASNELAESLEEILSELAEIQKRLSKDDVNGSDTCDPQFDSSPVEHEESIENQDQQNEEAEAGLLQEIDRIGCFTCLRCAVHTINLGIGAVLKKPAFSKPLSEIRSQVKRLKCVIFSPIFTLNKIKKPKLDCVTRWGSAYTMVDSFVNLEGIVDQLKAVDKSLKLSHELFDFARKFCVGFEPVQRLLKNLQQEQLTAGDFFKHYWIIARHELKQQNESNELAKMLLEALEARKEHLLGNPAFKAALFFDPRLTESFELSEDALDIQFKLNGLCHQPRLSVEKNVLEYWAAQETLEPELFKISQVVLAVPVTSVTVERAFNALTHILTAPRSNIEANNLEDIMIVRLNQELLSQ